MRNWNQPDFVSLEFGTSDRIRGQAISQQQGRSETSLGTRPYHPVFALVEERTNLATHIKADPPLEGLHTNPRWKELLRRMNLH